MVCMYSLQYCKAMFIMVNMFSYHAWVIFISTYNSHAICLAIFASFTMTHNELITLKSNCPKYRLELHKPLSKRYEVCIKKCCDIRIGISTKNAKKYLPVGCSNGSYAYSSRGYKFCNSYREVYGEPYQKGDIIGVEITNNNLEFYKNGRSMGVAYYNIEDECVYPGYSLYGDCELEVNYGKYQVYCKKASDEFFDVWE